MIELLAITDDATPPQPPLRLVPAGRVSVLVTPAPDGGAVGATGDEPAAGEDPADADALWQRESLLEELMRERALLPVRYGTRVADDAAAAAAVAPRDAELAAVLDRVRGAVEVSVRAVAPDGAATDTPEAVHERLSAAAREHARLEGPEALRAAYLVDTAAVDGFVATVRELQHEHPGLSILCTGPWPPYSFAEAPA
jgi:hypothetical protein